MLSLLLSFSITASCPQLYGMISPNGTWYFSETAYSDMRPVDVCGHELDSDVLILRKGRYVVDPILKASRDGIRENKAKKEEEKQERLKELKARADKLSPEETSEALKLLLEKL